MIQHVSPLVTGVLGAVLGALIAVLVMTLSKARARARRDQRRPRTRAAAGTAHHRRAPAQPRRRAGCPRPTAGRVAQRRVVGPAAWPSHRPAGRARTRPRGPSRQRTGRLEHREVATGLGLPNRPLAVRVAPLGRAEVARSPTTGRGAAGRRDPARLRGQHHPRTEDPDRRHPLLAEAIADLTDDADAVKHFAGRMSTETARSRADRPDHRPLAPAVHRPVAGRGAHRGRRRDRRRARPGPRAGRQPGIAPDPPARVRRCAATATAIEAALRNLIQNAIAFPTRARASR